MCGNMPATYGKQEGYAKAYGVRGLCMMFAALLLASVFSDVEIKPTGWFGSEVESAHITRGRIKTMTPVWNLDFGIGAEIGSYGYVTAGSWNSSDLCRDYRDRRHMLLNEMDPVVSYGYKFDLFEGVSLDSRVGFQWNVMVGYKGDGRRSYDEYQWRETLKTPWVTFYTFMRTFYHPYYAMALKYGVCHSFPIAGGLSFEPNIWFDGGTEHWNRRRFGWYTGSEPNYHRGPNSISVQLFLTYKFSSGWKIYGGLTQYSALFPNIREQLKAKPTREGVSDLLVGTIGISRKF